MAQFCERKDISELSYLSSIRLSYKIFLGVSTKSQPNCLGTYFGGLLTSSGSTRFYFECNENKEKQLSNFDMGNIYE